MSRFREVLGAIAGPLDFALAHPEGLERAASAQATLDRALARGAELRVPPSVRRRFAQCAERLRKHDLGVASAQWIGERLAPLRAEEFGPSVLAQSVDRIPGVGPKLSSALFRKELRCVEDLLFFWPRGYEDRRRLEHVEDLRVGHPTCFEGRVTRVRTQQLRNGRRVLEAVVADESGAVSLKWFRGIVHFQDRLRPGVRLLVAGEVRRYRYAKELHHPEIEWLDEDVSGEELARIVPVYPQIEGVAGRTLRRIVHAAVDYAADLVEGHLPERWVQRSGLPAIGDAVACVHLPALHLDPDELRDRTTGHHRRLAAEELFLLQVGFELGRRAVASCRTRPLAPDAPLVHETRAGLPFVLTGDQERAWAEIAADLGRPRPMHRLLVGDVGTGKTVLALLACAAARASGGLAVVLAPTEILAQQHAATFHALVSSSKLPVALLTGRSTAVERRRLIRSLRAGEIAVLVGTHALLTETLPLPELRLVVIDEQHRFGVAQRGALGQRAERPHLLIMTATPIPRTLALSLFSDLDHTELRQRPAGRLPVETRVVPTSAGRAVLAEIRTTIERGEQVFVVYPLVEESAKQDLVDATRGCERLRAALPEARIALVHGRQDPRERTAVMQAFAQRELDVLVATTVIEVGVDVPNATLLVVRHAERFGLAQLHQLRGRVGRGGRPGRAFLVADPSTETSSRRLAILEATQSGFEIAEEDLRIRGAGAWLGTQQAGHVPDLKLADLVRHGDLLPDLRGAARQLAEADPELARHSALRRAVERRWGRRLYFGSVA